MIFSLNIFFAKIVIAIYPEKKYTIVDNEYREVTVYV